MILWVFGWLLSFSSAKEIELLPQHDDVFIQKTQSNEIKIMSYNVYNLFDAVHDENSFDYTFLPKDYPGKQQECQTVKPDYYKKQCEEIDWTPEKLQKKIAQLVKVITEHGSKPDILALQEVENENVIQMFAKAAGYTKYVVTDYGTHRGIDVAVLYNPKKVIIEDESYVKSSGRAPFRVKFQYLPTKQSFYLYVNHWLAQSAPEKFRIQTAQALVEDIKNLMKTDKESRIIAVGDFNVTNEEAEGVFSPSLLNTKWKNHLVEVHPVARQKFPYLQSYFPDGSYYEGNNVWNRFDRFFVSQNWFHKTLPQINLESYRIIYSSDLTGTYKYKADEKDEKSDDIIEHYPMKFNVMDKPDRPLGYSDHLPISMMVRF